MEPSAAVRRPRRGIALCTGQPPTSSCRLWSRYVRRHPSLEDLPGITHTGAGIPGDPLNVALIGTETDVKRIMLAAKWYPADPLTLRSCLEIADAAVLKRPYDDAPVSNLYLFGRKEDLAFEQPVGDNPRKRHHVRFWRSEKTDPDGRPVWVGSATYDERVGLSRTTGQVTHHHRRRRRRRAGPPLPISGRRATSPRPIVAGFHKVLQGPQRRRRSLVSDGRLSVGVILSKAVLGPENG